jgi:ATP-dependent RNA helicase RhlE
MPEQQRSSFGKRPSNQGGFHKKSFSPRPNQGGFRRGPTSGVSRPGGFGGRPPQKRGGFTPGRMNISRFINKAVITEEAPNFVPEHQFEDFQIQPELKKTIITKGYVTPTPIQDRAIPHVIRGADVVGIANTGTGKTAAFLIPLINKVLLDRKQRVLIMVPTRELAVQINDELRGFTPGLQMFGVVCVGGANISPQMRDLRRRPNFVIGTPGRLKDLLERKALSLFDFGNVVLDEADRMLDMGFIHDMRQILLLLPTPRQTLFFSATLSSEIEKLIGEFLHEPVRISVKTGDTSKNVEQDVIHVTAGKNKLDMLHELLLQPEFNKVLVFGRTKHGVEKLAKVLVTRGIKAESIHGNKTQNGRQKALELFRRDHVQVLVATDVAARGLDINGVSHVINYDLPGSDEDYIHRIGRTGRAGKKGVALTFIEGR